MSQPLSSNRQTGFSLVELLVAMAILGIVLAIAGTALTSSMGVKTRELQLVEMQQNVRTAMQLLSQDARAGAFIHVWNSATCSHGVCSAGDRIALITTDGVMTTIPEPPGNSYNNSANTRVCDARAFQEGDLAIIISGDKTADLVEVTKVTLHANYDQPCRGPMGAGGGPNSDTVQHNKHKLTGSWSTSNHMFRARVVTYSLEEDPLDPGLTVLYRRTGLNTPQDQSGTAAFSIAGLDFAYGVPIDPDVAASQLIFYPSLEDAVTALGSNYSALPTDATKTYIGSIVEAVRISITGRTERALRSTGQPGEFTLTETVEFRR